MIKLHARLHHQRNGSPPGVDQLCPLPGQTMYLKRLLYRLWRGDLHAFQRLLRAARHRYFGTYDIHRWLAAALLPGAFRDAT
ncbi:hypothetical protein D3C72_2208930 [compost metagenome]